MIDFQIYIDDVNSGEVRVSQYGIRGTVCQDGWDDNDAKVICHQNGYLNGQTFGTLKLLSQIDPIWLSNVECLGDEASIYDCSFSMNLTTQCSSNVQPAGVICYNGTGNITLVLDIYSTIVKSGFISEHNFIWKVKEKEGGLRQLKFSQYKLLGRA